jgi:hypothetical protein
VIVKAPAVGVPGIIVPILGPGPCTIASALVVVSIRARPGATLDARGQYLHCRWEWPAADDPRRGLSPVRGISDTTGARQPIQIESDEGSFWVPASGKLELVGGTPGDEYEIEAFYYDRPAPPSLSVFSLTTTVKAGAAPLPVEQPPWHTRLRVVVGSVVVDGITLAPGPDSIPLSAVGMTANPGTKYRTEAIL